MVTQQERELAARLAHRQVQMETQALADGSAPVLRAMSVAILAAGKEGHDELRGDLWALKEQWRKTVFDYMQRLRHSAQQDELADLQAIVDAMRRESAEEPVEFGKPSIGRLRRLHARAVRPVAEVLDAG